MFDSPVLDVAIGLIFIFLLYSLLATTIKELVATIFSYRPRMLELALERMLDGKAYSYYWWDKLANVVLWLSNWVNLIFNFARKNKKPKPKKMRGFMDNKPLKAHRFRRAKLNKKAELFASRFVNHPIYKRAAEDSMFNKKPAYLTASTFSDILLDLFQPAGDKPLLLADIRTIIDSFTEDPADQGLNKDTKAILLLYVQQANGDLQRFRSLLEAWYNETMDRVSGWYKRQAYKVLFVIGLAVAASFNVDTVAIVRTLSTDKPTRDAMVKGASAYVQQQMQKVSPKTPAGQSVDTSKLHQDLDKITRIYKDAIAQSNVTLGYGWDKEVKKTQKEWNDKYQTNDYQSWCYYWFFFRRAVVPALLGFFITALAISLGSPFWFDLLNKFINLRVSGKRPEDEAPVSKAAAMNQKPGINSFG